MTRHSFSVPSAPTVASSAELQSLSTSCGLAHLNHVGVLRAAACLQIMVTYVEIYSDVLRDLLADSANADEKVSLREAWHCLSSST